MFVFLQSQDDEETSHYDITTHKPNPNPDHDHHYDILRHDRGPLANPGKPNLSGYDSVVLKEHASSSILPKTTTYDLAYQKSDSDSNNQQPPVSNPVYSLGGLSNNPMYGTSADVEEVKQSLESTELTENNTFTPVNGQQENNEIENSDEIPPPVPPQNF